MPEDRRLEELWAGAFGDSYTARNAAAAAGRGGFWRSVLMDLEVDSVLEVGCNAGPNLGWISELLPGARIAGVDINDAALRELRAALPDVEAVRAPATEVPFRDREFDLVFTTGVLIHMSDEALPEVMDEIVRSSRRYVLCGEYHADTTVEVPYRDQPGALFKRDFGGLYRKRFPELRQLDEGFLSREEGGWDDVTWWLFERTT